MKLTNQEQDIKSKMEHLNAPVDTAELWQSLEQHIPKQRRKRKLFIWFVFPVILGLFVLTLLFIFQAEEQESNQFIAEKRNDPITESDKTSEESKKKQKDESIAISPIDQNNLTSENKIITASTNSSISLYKAMSNNQTIHIDNSLSKHNILDQSQNNFSRFNSGTLNIEKLPVLYPELQLNQLVFNPELSNPYFLDKKPVRKPFYLTFNGQIGTGILSFESTPTEDKKYLEYLNDNSILKPIIGLELMVQKQVNYYISLQTGFQLERQVIAHIPKWERLEEKEIVSLSGATQTITRHLNYEAIGHLYHYNLMLPIQFDYNLFRSVNWEVNAYARMLLPVFTSSKGYFLENDLRLQKLSGNNTKWFNVKQEPNWKIGLDLQRRIRSNCYIKTSINYGKNVNKYPFAKKNIKENYQIYQLNLGLKYRLN